MILKRPFIYGNSPFSRTMQLRRAWAGRNQHSFSFSLVYLPIKAPTHEQNNLNNTNTTKHIYRVTSPHFKCRSRTRTRIRTVAKGVYRTMSLDVVRHRTIILRYPTITRIAASVWTWQKTAKTSRYWPPDDCDVVQRRTIYPRWSTITLKSPIVGDRRTY